MAYSVSRQKKILIHLHGAAALEGENVQKEQSIIASTEEYLRLYNDEDNKEKLEDILYDKTTVFIGYGLHELDVISWVSKMASQKNLNRTSLFILFPLKSQEHSIYEDLKIYYEGINIKAIPYSIDNEGYGVLEKIIKNWSRELTPLQSPAGTSHNLAVLKNMTGRYKSIKLSGNHEEMKSFPKKTYLKF